MTIASTPEPPYVAVIFTSLRTEGDNGYAVMSRLMDELVQDQPGFLGVESAREGIGITASPASTAHPSRNVIRCGRSSDPPV